MLDAKDFSPDDEVELVKVTVAGENKNSVKPTTSLTEIILC